MAWIDPKWRKQPAELRDSKFWTLKGYRLGCCSFTLTVDRSAMEGWGEVMSYACVCGWRGNREPELYCVAKETWGHWGGTPAEYEYSCPACGGSEVGENDDPDMSFKVTKRYKGSLKCAS